MTERVCPVQVDPMEFFGLLKWLDGRPLLDVMEPYRKQIHSEFLYTFRPDGSPRYKRGLKGRAKKNSKTTDEMLEGLFKLLAWEPAGNKGNQCYHLASDLGQANDGLDLAKKLVRCNPVLANEVRIKQNVIERRDGKGFLEILPAQDAPGLHGKTFLFMSIDELHTQKNYDLLTALELDRTRSDAVQSFASYASLYRHAGVPLVDMLKQWEAKSDPRLYVSWFAGSVEQANPSLNGPLGPTMEDVLDAQRSLPSWIFRRLYLNQPGQPDSAAFDAERIEGVVIPGRTVLPPQPGINYIAFVDLSNGGADDAVLAIAHEADGKAILDCLVDQVPRVNRVFSPEESVKKFALVLKSYRCSTVEGDRVAKQWTVQAFQKEGMTYRFTDMNKNQLYSAFEPLLNSGRVELLDNSRLLQQFIGLVRKNERIDHAATEHDDWANACAGACVRAASVESQEPWAFNFLTGEYITHVLSDDEKRLRKEAYLRGMDVDVLRHQYEMMR